ncbi:nucleotidyltransferase family protein [Sulfurirhabdus autotrophica]|uniref:Molybdenum cofactor cytidylyltransferase n=1 Tax=Sulfurirhabdus autotrophica TaxID=1706046 RepID=A0A4R3YF60_9PROT|nr:nucleotidyltransferase family protein [Sulfurirhabdus autotrophica]TCV90542.1 molybdenum cofactor cytidylyltransferase [Sulfurirhabdus autotrophica]
MITGILLAAGTGSRFGSNKLLHPLPDGTPIAIAAARTLLKSVEHGVAVLPDTNPQLADLLHAEGMEIIYCPEAAQGMGKSLACGVAASQNSSGWIIALADMPYIQTGTVTSVAKSLRTGVSIVAPSYQGKRGHPVGFGREFYSDLVQLNGDQGARQLLSKHASSLQLIPCEDAGILADIDQPSDLAIHSATFPVSLT